MVDNSGFYFQWAPADEAPSFDPAALKQAVQRVRETAHIVREAPDGRVGIAFGGSVQAGPNAQNTGYLHLGTLPPLYPEWLGNRAFLETHNLRFPYVGGAMANGITSPAMVIALARTGMLSFLGTAGLSLEKMAAYIDATRQELDHSGASWGANLIHSPQEPGLEMATVELFFSRGVTRCSASAFMKLTPAVVRYSARGLHRLPDGSVGRTHHLFAKISRPEVAEPFMRPAPPAILDALVQAGHITPEEAALASQVPVAEDIIVESDSGGHTDNRPLSALFPIIHGLATRITAEHHYRRPLRLGAAGGLGTPQAVAAAFALGADFVLTGSINQASVEANQSQPVKEMLANAAFTDVVMAPAGDMFEMGVEVQVLKRGTLFGSRAKKLFQIYSRYDSIEAIPAKEREKIEREIFHDDMLQIWEKTRQYFENVDPAQITRAEADPRHKLALVCRWYLGLSSKWAIDATPDRRLDYQVWMGPAQGAFNTWTKDTFLHAPENRHVAQIALNLLEGAAIATRAHQLRTHGAPIDAGAFAYTPRPLTAHHHQ